MGVKGIGGIGGIGAPTTAREWDLTSHGFLATFGVRRFPKGERKALWRARRRIPIAPAGTVGLPP